MSHKSGRHFLQIPGPTNVPDRILRAISQPNIDHRGPDFARLGAEVLEGIKPIFKTESPVIIYPASGTGAWEAALVNTLSAGDRVVMFETGQFSLLWKAMAERLGLVTEFIGGDWRRGANAGELETILAADTSNSIKAVCVVHNDTSTGITSNIANVRTAMDKVNHPALLMVDAVSSLGSIDYRHDEWGVDVTIAGSQKGLMLPAGLSFNAISDKALSASKTAKLPKSYWAWDAMLAANKNGMFPYTPATNLLYGLREAINMLTDEGMENVFARHIRLANASRRAVEAWGLDMQALNASEFSHCVTAVRLPEGHDANAFMQDVLEKFDMSLGSGLGKIAGQVFRIGHLGDMNDLTLAGTLSGVEMGLKLSKIPHQTGGITAALNYLAETSP